MVKKILKLKAITIILGITLFFAMAFPSSATELHSSEKINVISPEFPNAYIVINRNHSRNTSTTNDNSSQMISATVFVEEEYQYIGDEIVVTNSRLLSKEEVEKIGEANFDNLSYPLATSKTAYQSRGKLTISFSGNGSHSSTSSQYNLIGGATWSRSNNPLDPASTPSSGNDYMGIAWSGGFSYSNPSCTGTLAPLNSSATIYTADSSPNAGIVWEFMEYANAGGAYQLYLNNLSASLKLSKNKLEGNGNTAQAVLKYIHTYQTSTGSISISASASGIGAGFSLSNTSKQWSIICSLTDLYY